MKKDTTLSALFGLTQSQMSLLLQVHPSQWSMHESGKRDLPLKPKQVLSEMIGFLKSKDKGIKVKQHIIKQEQSRKECLEKLLKKNEFELYKINRKIEDAERKYNDNIKVIGLVEYLTTLQSTKEALDAELLEGIASKAEKALKKSGLANLTELNLKKELLQQEKSLLNSYA